METVYIGKEINKLGDRAAVAYGKSDFGQWGYFTGNTYERTDETGEVHKVFETKLWFADKDKAMAHIKKVKETGKHF